MESHTLVPFFVEGKTRRDLVKNMLKKNVEKGGFVKYFDIQKDGDLWVAWYYEDLKNMVKMPAPETKPQKVSKKKVRKKS